jgi:hypothetical protein
MKRKRPDVSWLTMGPSPYLATCGRCGEHVPMPRLPKPLDAMILYMNAQIALHAVCKEKADVAADLPRPP